MSDTFDLTNDNNELITIEATFIAETEKSYHLDCEGNKVWFPKSYTNFKKDKSELVLPRWLARKKFPDENL